MEHVMWEQLASAEKMLDEGKMGFSSGEGFMKWTPEAIDKSKKDLNEYLIKMVYGK